MKPTILIVDDEPGVRNALSGVLSDEGYAVKAVATGEACLERLTRGAVDLIVLDVWLPGMDGLATFARLRERQVHPLRLRLRSWRYRPPHLPPLRRRS